MARLGKNTLSPTEWGAAGKAAELEEAAFARRAAPLPPQPQPQRVGLQGAVPPATSVEDAALRRGVLNERARNLGIGSKFGQAPAAAESAAAPRPGLLRGVGTPAGASPAAPVGRFGQMLNKVRGFPGVRQLGKVAGVAGTVAGAAPHPVAKGVGLGLRFLSNAAVGAGAYSLLSGRPESESGTTDGVAPSPLVSVPKGFDVMRGRVGSGSGVPGSVPPTAAPAAPAAPAAARGFAPTSFTRMGPAETAAMNTSLRDGTIAIPRPGTGTIMASDNSGGTRIDASGERERILEARNAQPPSVFGGITAQNNERYEERKAQARFGLETARLGAAATNNVARARLGMELSDKSAKALNESIDKWSMKPPADGKGAPQVDPTRRNQLNTFITQVYTGKDKDGKMILSDELRADPATIERIMPVVVRALDEGAEVNELATNPGFMRSIMNAVGVTDAAQTTLGDYQLDSTRRATFGDMLTNKNISLKNWAVGDKVATTNTGVTRTLRDIDAQNLQRRAERLRRQTPVGQ